MQTADKKQRCNAFYGYVATHRLKIKNIVEEAGFNSLASVYVALRRGEISDQKLDILESIAAKMAKEKSSSNPNRL
ncbi:MAG: hypothetical protein WEB89_07190 [Balneolales bacterium]